MVSTSVKDHAVTRPRDLHYGDDPIMLRWNKTRCRCRNPDCARPFTESIAQVPPRRARPHGCAARSARRSGTRPARSPRSPPATACRGRRAPRVRRPRRGTARRARPARSLGIDETRRGKPRWQHCGRRTAMGAGRPVGHRVRRAGRRSGPARPGEGRTKAAVIDWLTAQTAEFRDPIKLVVIDPSAVYASSVRTPGCCPTRHWWLTISIWSSSPTTWSPPCAGGSPSTPMVVGAVSRTRNGPTGADYSAHENDCRTGHVRGCGTH